MARKPQNKVSYFPHPVTHSKKMSYLEKKYKNDGYATWFKLLEELGNTNYHYLNLSDEIQVMFLSDKCLVSEETLFQIINDLVKFKEFDKELWEQNRILFNQNFIDSIQDAYKKRNNNCIEKQSLLLLLDSLGVRKIPKSTLKGGENTQIKENKIKEDKSKLNKSILNNIPLSEINISDLEKNEIEYFEIALAFQQLFIKNLKEKNAPTNHQEKATYKNYVNPIRLMISNDGVSKQQLQKVFKFLDSPGGSFWKDNILSTSKLREKFQQLILKSQSPNEQQNNNQKGATDDFRRKTAARLGVIQSE